MGLLCLLFALPAAAERPEWSYVELPPRSLPAPGTPYPVFLRHDDGSAEGAFGVAAAGGTARQFMWLQQFETTIGFQLESLRVLFPAGQGIPVGGPIQLLVYRDSDAVPGNGATLLRSIDSTVQAADGSTFSSYALDAPLALQPGGSILIGVVPRFIVSGSTPLTHPAAVDSGGDGSRSWVASWSGDPPAVPELPPDQSLFTLAEVVDGTWIVQGLGISNRAIAIPVFGAPAAGLAVLLLAAAGLRSARRRSVPR